jgi:hypothetical protein
MHQDARSPAEARVAMQGLMHGMHAGMGHGMGGHGMYSGRGGDAAYSADMQVVHAMLHNNGRIVRKVTHLPDGIRTVTESDDPQVARWIKEHVAAMMQRLKDGRVFNLFSETLPVLFERRDAIRTEVVTSDKGVVVTQVSAEPKVVAALQAHAAEVDEMVRDGMVAMMRGMHRAMGMRGHMGPMSQANPHD